MVGPSSHPLISPLKANHLHSLEVLRGMAACAIVLYHSFLFIERQTGVALIGGMYSGLELGVDFFFVLSGFIILWRHEQDFGQPATLWPYLRRRLWRILPLLWLATFAKAILLSSQGQTVPAELILRSLLLLPGWQGEGPLIVGAWSLTHEMIFYLLLLPGLIWGARTLVMTMALWLALILGCSLWQPTSAAWHRPLWDSHNLAFGWGMVSCLLLRHWQPLRRPHHLASPALLALGAVLILLAARGHVQTADGDLGLPLQLCAGAGFAALLLAACLWELRSSKPLPKLALATGRASYSIYLGHSLLLLPLIALFMSNAPQAGFLRLYGIAIGSACLATVACLLLWRFVEMPLLRMGQGDDRHRGA